MNPEQRAKLEPWQEGMPCRFRGDGLCIANCAAACRCLSPTFLWAEAVTNETSPHVALVAHLLEESQV